MKKKSFKVTVNRFGFFCFSLPQKYIKTFYIHNSGCNLYENKLLEVFNEVVVYFDNIRIALKIIENRFDSIDSYYTDSFHGIDLKFTKDKLLKVVYTTNVGSSKIDNKVLVPIQINESVTLDIDKNVPYVVQITIDYVNHRGD